LLESVNTETNLKNSMTKKEAGNSRMDNFMMDRYQIIKCICEN